MVLKANSPKKGKVRFRHVQKSDRRHSFECTVLVSGMFALTREFMQDAGAGREGNFRREP